MLSAAGRKTKSSGALMGARQPSAEPNADYQHRRVPCLACKQREIRCKPGGAQEIREAVLVRVARLCCCLRREHSRQIFGNAACAGDGKCGNCQRRSGKQQRRPGARRATKECDDDGQAEMGLDQRQRPQQAGNCRASFGERDTAIDERDQGKRYDLSGRKEHEPGRQEQREGGNVEWNRKQAQAEHARRDRRRDGDRMERARHVEVESCRSHERRKVVRGQRSGHHATGIAAIRFSGVNAMFASAQRFVAIGIGACVKGGSGTIKIGKIVELAPRERIAEPGKVSHRRDGQKGQRHDDDDASGVAGANSAHARQ